MLFEHDFTQTSTASFGGLGPAYVRSSCIHCHPGYGHGKRVNSYQADQRGNGYLLVVYHPADGVNSDDGPYIAEVTGMPQTKAVSPFLPPIDENGIHIDTIERNRRSWWTNGFWGGLNWLLYAYTKNEEYKTTAKRSALSSTERDCSMPFPKTRSRRNTSARLPMWS